MAFGRYKRIIPARIAFFYALDCILGYQVFFIYDKYQPFSGCCSVLLHSLVSGKVRHSCIQNFQNNICLPDYVLNNNPESLLHGLVPASSFKKLRIIACTCIKLSISYVVLMDRIRRVIFSGSFQSSEQSEQSRINITGGISF